jgi:hypothetical protein
MALSPYLVYKSRRDMASMRSPPCCVYIVHRDLESPLRRAHKVPKAILPMLVTATEFIGLCIVRALKKIKLS